MENRIELLSSYSYYMLHTHKYDWFVFFLIFFSASSRVGTTTTETDTIYEVAVSAFNIPVAVSPHYSHNIIDGRTSLPAATVASTSAPKSDNRQSISSNGHNQFSDRSSSSSESDRTVLILTSAFNSSGNSSNGNVMVQHSVRKSYDDSVNPSVIIQNAQSRLLTGNASVSPVEYSQLGMDSPSGMMVVNGSLTTSPSTSPVRYSTLQTIGHNVNTSNGNSVYLINSNNNIHNNNNNINNDNNNYGDWSYLSLDLRHKPADIDKIHEKNGTVAADNEHMIEQQQQRNIIATTNGHHHQCGSASDIQADHCHDHISPEAAAIRTGVMPMYSGHSSSSASSLRSCDRSGGVGAGTGANNSTIDEVIADTLKDEDQCGVSGGDSCGIVGVAGDETSNYMKMMSANPSDILPAQWKGTPYCGLINNNNSASSTGGGGDSRSPSGDAMLHDPMENSLHDFTNLTSAQSIRTENITYSASALQSEHAAISYEAAVISSR